MKSIGAVMIVAAGIAGIFGGERVQAHRPESATGILMWFAAGVVIAGLAGWFKLLTIRDSRHE